MPVSEYSKDTDRTTDVQTQDRIPFSTIISDNSKILKGLTECGYIHASPIQVAALPTIIAGNDTIVEAKNGTGKTLTFVIPILMRLNVEQSHLQSIILAPTREIAVQISQCIKKVGQDLPGLKCEYFIGGTPVDVDKQKANGCQIAVGSPGRIKHLLNEHVLKGSKVKSFILDEVDKLFTDKSFTKDVRLIDAKLPKLKQMIVVSASIDTNNMSIYDEFMKEYTVVKGAEEDMNASQDPSKFLLGIKQYVACVKAVSTNIILLPAKNVRLLNILQNLPYTQCIIFTNYMTRVEAVCNMLRDHNYKADYIRGDQDQNVRLKLVDRLRSFKSKILVATDLIARGINSSNVDLVINMDCPNDWATYLHRIGRAGRFGNKGYAFTILDDDKELKSFKGIINSIESIKIKMLPIAIYKPILEYADDELEDLNLVVEFDVLTKNYNGNNLVEENGNIIIEDNKKDNEPNDSELKFCSETESNVSNIAVESKHKSEIKSIYGPGISEEESLMKLRQVVEETEKKIIDNNLVNTTFLTDKRTFILFDPEPFLDDTAQYQKYSADELGDLILNYNSDIECYEAAKKLKSAKKSLQKESIQECSNKVCLENIDQISDTSTEKTVHLEENIQECSNKVCLENIDQISDTSTEKTVHLEENIIECSNEACLENINQISDTSTEKTVHLEENIIECSNEACLENIDQISDTSTNHQLQKQHTLLNNCVEKQSCNEDFSKNNLSNSIDNNKKVNTNTSERSQFFNIYDLFNIPDFSIINQSKHKITDEPSADNNSAINNSVNINESDKSPVSEKDDTQEKYCEEEESSYFEEEEEEELSCFEEEEEELEEEIEVEEEIISDSESSDEDLKNESYDDCIENESCNEDLEFKNYINEKNNYRKYLFKYCNNSTIESTCTNIQENNVTSQSNESNISSQTNKYNVSSQIVEDDDEHYLVDYDILNNWYRQWKQQMSFIQTCVKMSK